MKFLLCLLFFSPLNGFAQMCYIHISKTAGTTMHTMLLEHFGAANIYSCRGIGESGIIVDKTISLPEIPIPAPSIISGHFPLWWLQKTGLAQSSFCFTILREPIERVISHYFFKLKFGYLSLGLPVHSPLDVVPNLMCRMLTSDPTLTGEELLENAIHNLENLDFIVFLDDFEGGIRRLFRKIGSEHKGNIPKLNETIRGVEFDRETLNKIAESNELDVRVYDYATRFLRHKSL